MEERFYGVEGDVTLSHALNHIIDKYPEGAKEARVYLSRMSGKGGMEP